MAFDSLATPLGTKPKASISASRWTVKRVVLVLLAFVAVALLGLSAIRSTRQSVDPVARAPIERLSGFDPSEALERRAAPPQPVAEQGDRPPRASAHDVENESGVRVVRQNGGSAPGAAVIRVPDSTREPDRPVLAPADPRLAERVALGFLPKIAEGGLMPRQAYARPFTSTNKPRIAVVLTGVGVSARSTTDAISRLPGEFTLAFAPYGRDLEAQVQRARRDGHEILLQIPMEPFDFPDSDPGPHTLRATSSARENIERLHWLMTRFSGYVGLMNFMGGRLMSTPPALQPLFEEMQRRGLMFLDDGSVRRGQSVDVAGRVKLPILKADRVVDSTGEGQGLRAALDEAEKLAQRQGSAIVTVPALPGHIEYLMRWERDLAQKNIVIAPVSALLSQQGR
jgi:polysaccharide deacetylase 2 family uncharacterized protein YibQ